MEEEEFRSRLQLFPVVRSRDYRADLSSSSSKQSTSLSVVEREDVTEWHDAPSAELEPKDLTNRKTDQDTFWDKLKTAAEKKVGQVEAERFCKAFEKLHKKLVYEELDPEAAKRYLLNS